MQTSALARASVYTFLDRTQDLTASLGRGDLLQVGCVPLPGVDAAQGAEPVLWVLSQAERVAHLVLF